MSFISVARQLFNECKHHSITLHQFNYYYMGKIAINIATGTLQKEEIIVGIDLGTTNSLVAIIHPDTKKPVALKETDGLTIVPSIIYFDAYDVPVVGEPARKHLVTEPERTVFSVKRLLGKRIEDIVQHEMPSAYKLSGKDSEMASVQIGERYYSPVTLSSYILAELKQRAEHVLKTPVKKAVITVPAYFNDAQRQASRDAGRLAGLDVLRIINEPTAASLAYGLGLDRNKNKTVAVYDFGGGTFDISILKITDGVFEVLATHGDTQLGGDDIDQAIMQYWMENQKNAVHQIAPGQLRLLAEEAKITVNTGTEFNYNKNGVVLTLTDADLESVLKPVIGKTLVSCASALKDSGLGLHEIDEVILVGGSTRLHYVKKSVSAFFEKQVHDDLNPDETVALGAAIQADILAGNTRDLLLLDVTPLSLGVETAGGLMDVLMPRNSRVPSAASRQYTTQADGQSGMRISVYQGERDLVKDNRKLGEFNLKNIPPMPAGLPKIEIRFMINADGILKVSAKEMRSGVEQEVDIQASRGLSDAEVEQMLLDSLTHAESDVQARALAEAITEAEQILKTTEKFLGKHANALEHTEIMQTAQAMQALQLSLTMSDKNLIVSKTEELNNVSRPYAERIMNTVIATVAKEGGLGKIENK